MSMSNAAYLLIPAFLWGTTEPLMKRYGREGGSTSPITLVMSNRGYAFAYATNQLGAVLFFLFLKFNDLTVAVPFANSVKYIFNYAMGRYLGEEALTGRKALGLGLILAGIFAQLLI